MNCAETIRTAQGQRFGIDEAISAHSPTGFGPYQNAMETHEKYEQRDGRAAERRGDGRGVCCWIRHHGVAALL
jgi:hypothetical protein